MAELDKRVDDDLTKTILGRWVRLLPSRRGITVPEEAADLGEDGDSPAGPGNLGDISAIVDASIAERARNRDAAVASLWREHGPAEIVDVLDERLRAITAAHQSREIQGMIELLGGLGAARPAALPDLVAEAVALPDGPLDLFLHALLDAWARSDINAFAIALPPIIAARQGVASAAAYGFRVHHWASLDPRLVQVHREAMVAARPQQRGRWLAGAGEMLRSDPVAAVPIVIAAAGDSWGVAEALDEASHYDPDDWIASLEAEQSLAVLALTRVCGWRTWGVQRVVSGIARTHPRVVLDMLTEDSVEGPRMAEVDGLPEALGSHEPVLADWLRLLLSTGPEDEGRIAQILPAALGKSLTEGAATAVEDVVESANADEILRLVRMLWLCNGFTLAHPALVGRLLARAEALQDQEELEEVKRRLIALAVPTDGLWSPAAADETHVARLDHSLRLAQDMTLSATARTIFSESATTLQAVMDEEGQQWRDDER